MVKNQQQLLNDMIRTYTSSLNINAGITNPAVNPGSSTYLEFKSVSSEVAVGLQQIEQTANEQLPDTATGANLDRWCAFFGLRRRGATTASGFITISHTLTSGTVLVPAGSQLLSSNGLVYATTLSNNYSNGDTIEVRSVDTGSAANLDAGETLTWQSPPPFTQPVVTVSADISGGAEAEDDETLRSRLQTILSTPSRFGNWTDIAQLSESFDSAVQKAFIYPGVDGYATEHIAVTGYTTKTDKTRNISDIKLTNLTDSIKGNRPSNIITTVTTVENVNFDLSLNVSIPYPVGAPNLGTGGGWLDFAPFPLINVTGSNHDGSANYAFCFVSSVISNSTFIIKAPSGLNIFDGITKISWINKSNDWTVVTSTITASSISSNEYTVTIDSPFIGVAVNEWIFPASENGQNYLNTILDYFETLGPGEKTNVSSLISTGMALRKPRAEYSYPAVIDDRLSRTLTNKNNEILDVDFAARRAGGAEIGNAKPDLPSVITNSPKIYIPRNIGFYPVIKN